MADSSTTPASPDADLNPIPGEPDDDRFWNTDQQQDSYKITSGIALIINNKTFKENEVRNGTDKDRDALVKLWKSFNFTPFVENDLSSGEMKAWLKEQAERSGREWCKCVVVCILSHGGENTVSGSDDKEVPIDELVELFHNDNVDQSLVGKPKMFFIQACRGDKEAQGRLGLVGGGESNESAAARGPAQQMHSSTADILVCNSTAPGHTSRRNPVYGSCYIQCLVDVFNLYHMQEHVLDMMTRVTGALAMKFRENHHQTPSFRSQLKAKVFLQLLDIPDFVFNS